MKYRRLGASNLLVSEIALRSWLTYSGGAGAAISRALWGIRRFITASSAVRRTVSWNTLHRTSWLSSEAGRQTSNGLCELYMQLRPAMCSMNRRCDGRVTNPG